MKRRSLLLLVVIVGVLAGGFTWHLKSERVTPAGQPPLATLSAASLETLRTDFNRHADKVRIVVLLSPT